MLIRFCYIYDDGDGDGDDIYDEWKISIAKHVLRCRSFNCLFFFLFIYFFSHTLVFVSLLFIRQYNLCVVCLCL